MSKTIDSNKKGIKIYDGLLSKEERVHADKILNELKTIIPNLEKKLEGQYSSKNNMYRYFLGKNLSDLIDKYEITDRERVYFWNEIKFLASTSQNKIVDRSKYRNDYEYCYLLSHFDINTVNQLSWRQWSSLLDRKKIICDDRIIVWISNIDFKIKENHWRDFLKALNLFVKNKDTIVFDNQEIFYIFNYIYKIISLWYSFFEKYFNNDLNNMTTARGSTQTLSKYKKKYYKEALKYKSYDKDSIIQKLEDIFMEIYLIEEKL